jgi:outer membrane protein assembly factor BamB
MRAIPSLLLAALGLSQIHAEDWPQWRGPARDGSWHETGLVEKFATDELQPLWTAPVGAGYSGPAVAGDRVFVTDRVPEPDEQERVLCLDRSTGASLWSFAYPCRYQDIDYALGPRASVTIADGRAFALGAMGHLHCLDAATGKLLWGMNLAAETRAIINVWGVTAAPLVVGGLVIVQIGGQADSCLIGLDVRTGKQVWRALDGRASYSSPRLIRQGGQQVLLAWTGSWLAAVDPLTGRVLWKDPFKPQKGIINVPDPVLDESGQHVFLTSFYDGSFCFALKPDAALPDLVWQRRGASERRTDALHSMIMTPLVRDGHVYGIDSYGEMRCLNLKTGDRVWEDTTLLANGRWATAYFVQNGDRTWITTEKGEIVIARLTPKGFERISSARFITPVTSLRGRSHPIAWSHPAYAGKCLFARSDKELVCISLSRPTAP